MDRHPPCLGSFRRHRAYLNGVELDFCRPGKLTDNAFIEAFNGRFRQECLNENWFLSLEGVVEKVEPPSSRCGWTACEPSHGRSCR